MWKAFCHQSGEFELLKETDQIEEEFQSGSNCFIYHSSSDFIVFNECSQYSEERELRQICRYSKRQVALPYEKTWKAMFEKALFEFNDNISEYLTICRLTGLAHEVHIYGVEELLIFDFDKMEVWFTKRNMHYPLIPSPVPTREIYGSSDVPVPTYLCCPITQDLIRDPVLASDGFTYEREAIEKWFSTKEVLSEIRSPMTRKVFDSCRLFPNNFAKGLIQEFVQTNNITIHATSIKKKPLTNTTTIMTRSKTKM